MVPTYDVDVALIELPETSPLRRLPAVDPLDLVAAEREGEPLFVLGHVPGEGYRQVETQGQIRFAALLPRPGRLDEVDLSFGLSPRLGEKDLGEFDGRSLQLGEAETFVSSSDRVEHSSEGDLFFRQELEDSGHRSRCDHGVSLEEVSLRGATAAG